VAMETSRPVFPESLRPVAVRPRASDLSWCIRYITAQLMTSVRLDVIPSHFMDHDHPRTSQLIVASRLVLGRAALVLSSGDVFGTS
jgi:hypothetical protein